MKKKLQTRFPATRIKKIMQTDEDIGKIAMAVPLLVSKALELFLQDLCNHTYDVTLSRGVKTVNSIHLKQCVHAFNIFDFLRDIVSKVPDFGNSEGEESATKRRKKVVNESSCNDEVMKTTDMQEVKHIGGGRGKRGKGHRRGGGRMGSGQSLKFEDDVEDASPRSSRSPSSENVSLSHEEKKPECVQEDHNKGSYSGLKERNFDLNERLDENGDSATSLEIQLEGNPCWPFLGINEMKINPCRQASADDEDYDEES